MARLAKRTLDVDNPDSPFDITSFDRLQDHKPRILKISEKKQFNDISFAKYTRNHTDIADEADQTNQIRVQVIGENSLDTDSFVGRIGQDHNSFEDNKKDFDSNLILNIENPETQNTKIESYREVKINERTSGRIEISKQVPEVGNVRYFDTSTRREKGSLSEGNQDYLGNRERIQQFWEYGETLNEPYYERTYNPESIDQGLSFEQGTNKTHPDLLGPFEYGINGIAKNNVYVEEAVNLGTDEIPVDSELANLYKIKYYDLQTINIKKYITVEGSGETFDSTEFDYESYTEDTEIEF